MNLATSFWTWFGAFLTFCIFSFLYKDNPFYKFAEHLFVGVSVGYSISISYHNVLYPDLIVPLFRNGELLNLVPLIFGLCYFTRFLPKVSWLVRLPMGLVLGFGAGAAIPAVIQASIIKQVQGAILTPDVFKRFDLTVWALISLIGVICTVTYFFFSRERGKVTKVMADLGIIFLMVGFGASFGYTVMARISLLIGRFQFLLRDWLGVIK
ncbi:MAG: hypothetical protein NZ601_05315 [candidate division WOR-3 bacterium]|nr:hypothetical protein [candidate division WOR-3 bacterium]MCX7756957.1 hypothetical protein [candidate division WOR-3 bacterium]MDW7988247.1 hypothetical protein [candidate division WOR-3 bacterium]